MAEKYILRSKEKFGTSWFDYSEMEYKTSKQKIKIICTKHKHNVSFMILLPLHTKQKFGGCKICSSSRSVNSTILKAKQKFGKEMFDYSDLQYKNYATKINIRCKTHDHTFQILLNNHLRSKFGGCNICKDSDKSSEIKLQCGEEKKELPWKEFKDLYCVTTFGRVFNKKTATELTYTKINERYSVPLYDRKQKKCFSFRLHKLVWECCEGSFDKKFLIYHKDRNVKNNRIDNLVCVTRSFAVLRSNLLKSIRDLISDFFQVGLIGAKLQPGAQIVKNHKVEEQKTCSDFKSIGIIFGYDFRHYMINSQGAINNSLTNKTRKLGKLRPGHRYKYITLISKQGRREIALHKLVAKVHLTNGETFFNATNYEVTHTDENTTNNNAENLQWIMNSNVVATSDFKSIGKIDGYNLSHYEINSQGTVINKKRNNQILKAYKRNGYLYVDFNMDSQKRISCLTHRLVGKVFFKNGEEYFKKYLKNGSKKYVINHKNKNRTNNCVENLEWTTPSGNMIHSCGIRVIRIDPKTGEELQTYNTIKEAGAHLKQLLVRDKICTSGIGLVCRGTQKTCWGFGWRYVVNDEEEKEIYPSEDPT